MKHARVIANHGAELLLMDADGVRLSVAGNRKHGLIVVGDRVSLSGSGNSVKIDTRLARDTTLSRTDRNGSIKPLAANITQVVVVCAALPEFDLLLIDQYLVAARTIGTNALLVINKADLLTNESRQMADTIEDIYTAIGIQVLRCCAQQAHTLEPLREALRGEISILVGQSGVGKSTLLSSLVGDPDIRTGRLSTQSGLGRHTTTVASWYELAEGGAIIDSAGVRQFGLEHLPQVDIQSGFSEIAEAAADCRFNDCRHLQEPACAVRARLDEQLIQPSRYHNFCKLRDRAGGQ